MDFYGSHYKPANTTFGIRNNVSRQDTAYLLIENTKTVLYEKRFIYTDQGFFKDQFLEIENYNQDISRRIEKTEILEIERSTIKVKVLITNYSMQNEKAHHELDSEIVEFWVEKEKLNGVLIKK